MTLTLDDRDVASAQEREDQTETQRAALADAEQHDPQRRDAGGGEQSGEAGEGEGDDRDEQRSLLAAAVALDEGQHRLLVPGFTDATAMAAAPAAWPFLSQAVALAATDVDVLVDVGRFGSAGSPVSLLEMADADEKHGLGDMPYPPNYPKMPGEPKRVQPSRARR